MRIEKNFKSGYSAILAILALSLVFSGCSNYNIKSSANARHTYYENAYITPADPNVPEDRSGAEFNTETYDHIVDNPFLDARSNPLSTFSIDVDTASYSNMRRFLEQNQLPPKGAVRIEELVNYFDYDYIPPKGEHPFSSNVEIADCPWNNSHQLARIALKGKVFEADERPVLNLVFLIDVSGSMYDSNKLPLLKSAMKLMVTQLDDRDRVSIVTYASGTKVALSPTSGRDKRTITRAFENLKAGGSTSGGAGIQLAYQTAEQNFVPDEVNRVILCTDGDFNVGITNQSDLVDLIEQKAKSGVFLTVLGFGMGNYKDSTLEKLADKGNGNYGYIDTIDEANKMLLKQFLGSMVTIAKDVKIQIEFNPAKVGAYRLIGYENRLLRAEDFNDDAKDAGEIGAGHTVTAFYELVPPGNVIPGGDVDPLKYQVQTNLAPGVASDDYFTMKIRYKDPEEDTSRLLVFPITDAVDSQGTPSPDFRFAASVAAFGMLLRESPYKGTASIPMVRQLALEGKGTDADGYREEFLRLIKKAEPLLLIRE